MIPKSILPIGTEVCYRNNSAGGGTLVHITKENGKQYCGFQDFCSEHVIVDETDYYLESQVCKKCLGAFKKEQSCHPSI
jgi:hypothetical protein